MTRRKIVAREPNGRAQRRRRDGGPPQLDPASEVTRLRHAALNGMRDAAWGSTLGWLYLSGKISGTQFAAGKRWAELCEDYTAACLSPHQPRSARLEQGAGKSIDPDSPKGNKEVRRFVQTVKGYMAALVQLRRTGEPPRRAVMDVCELNQMPTGQDNLNELRTGLQTLAAFWAGERRPK